MKGKTRSLPEKRGDAVKKNPDSERGKTPTTTNPESDTGKRPTEENPESKTETTPTTEESDGQIPTTQELPEVKCRISYTRGRALALNGDWELYPDLALKPAGHVEIMKKTAWKRQKLPAQWKDAPFTKHHRGPVWYRCSIYAAMQVEDNLALYLGVVQDSDEVYFNNHLVGKTETDLTTPRLYPLPVGLWRRGDNLILIRLVGSRPASGFQELPRIENELAGLQKFLFRSIPEAILSSLYLLFALFFGAFATIFRRRREFIPLALLTAALGLQALLGTISGREFFSSFEAAYRLRLLLLIPPPVLFLAYLTTLTEMKKPPLIRYYQLFYALLFVSTVLASTPPQWDMVFEANMAGLLVGLVIAGWIVRRKYGEYKSRLRPVLLGVIPLLPALINDLLVHFGLIATPPMMLFAGVLFLGFTALQPADSVLALYRGIADEEDELVALERRKDSTLDDLHDEFKKIFEALKEAFAAAGAGYVRDAGRRKSPAGEKKDAAIRRLENLTEDLQLLPSLEKGGIRPQFERFNIRRECQEVIDGVLLTTGEKRGRLNPDLPAENEECVGDPNLFRVALRQLLENALIYTAGQVDLSVEFDGRTLITHVRDEGPGLSSPEQERAFKKFVRGEGAGGEIPGAGVGLTIALLIARLLGGSLRLEGGGGYFSIFVLKLPASAQERPGG